MTADVPRRLRPNSAQRTNKILTQTRGAPSAKGSTAAARPVSTLHRAQTYVRPTVTVVVHGDDGTVARPDAALVYWVGAATPDNGRDYDFWYTEDV